MVVQLALSALLFVSVNYAEAQVQAPSAYFSLPAKAQFYPLLGRRFVARCRMDWCHWLRLENVRLIGRSSKGELYAVSSNSWTSGPHRGGYKKRAPIKPSGGKSSYVFCSKTMPAVMYEDVEKRYFLIFPGTGHASGPAETIYVLYWATCHRTATTEGGMDKELGKRFGYKLANPDGNTVKDIALNSVRDVLKW
jgi:hypothetical protein